MDIECIVKAWFVINKYTYFESHSECNISFELKNNSISIKFLSDVYGAFSASDNVKIELCYNEEYGRLIINNINHVNKKRLDEFYDEDFNFLFIDIVVLKNIVDDFIHVYSWRNFEKWLLEKHMIDIINIFNVVLENREGVIFKTKEPNVYLETSTISFTNGNSDNISKIYRETKVNQFKEYGHFEGMKKLNLLPKDFSIKNSSNCENLVIIFNKIKTLLSIIYLSSVSSLYQNYFTYKIYESTCIIENIEDISYNMSIYDLYTWVYSGEDYFDKILLTKNVLGTIGIKDFSSVDLNTIGVIQTNYQLYRKKNVERYIELKNQLSKFILEMTNNTSGLITNLSNKIKNNIVVVASFLFTIILTNSVSNNSLNNIFTAEVTWVCYMGLIISFGLWILAIMETNSEERKIEYAYNAIKKNYENIFSMIELSIIFDDDNIYTNMHNQFIKERNILFIFWLLVIIILFIIIENLSDSQPVFTQVKSFFKIIESIMKLNY